MRIVLLLSLILALTACVDRSVSPVRPDALSIGTPTTVFAATTRVREDDGSFGPDRAEQLSLLELTVSVPPNHVPGSLSFGYENANPEKQFVLADREELTGPSELRTNLRRHVTAFPAGSRELVLFVHGFNSTQTEAAFRAAQLAHDVNVKGALMIYSWPSRGHPLAYAYDGDSAIFARDGLEKVLRQLPQTGADRITVAAHSMGSLLLMETLRQIELQEPGWSARNLDGVALISPDLDVEVFRSQILRMASVPQPFTILVSEKDNILNLSRRLRGTHTSARLGQISSASQVTDLPVTVIDTTVFSDDAESGHLVAATSPTMLALINSARQTTDLLEAGTGGLEQVFPGLVTYGRDASPTTR